MSLSDKEVWRTRRPIYHRADVKEFIRELKTNLVLVNTVDDSFIETMNERMYRIIDKLAGDKLI